MDESPNIPIITILTEDNELLLPDDEEFFNHHHNHHHRQHVSKSKCGSHGSFGSLCPPQWLTTSNTFTQQQQLMIEQQQHQHNLQQQLTLQQQQYIQQHVTYQFQQQQQQQHGFSSPTLSTCSMSTCSTLQPSYLHINSSTRESEGQSVVSNDSDGLPRQQKLGGGIPQKLSVPGLRLSEGTYI